MHKELLKGDLKGVGVPSNMATDRDLYVKQCMKVNDLIFHSKIITRNMGHFAPALVVSG
jgi:hypothetical protein